MFELAFRPAPFGVARTSTCSCDACQGNAHEFEGLEDDFEELDVCPECGEVHELESDVKLRDIVIDPSAEPGVYGKKSSYENPPTTKERCTKTEQTCPNVTGKLRALKEIDGVPIEYVGATKGLIWGKTVQRWLVNEYKRIRRKTIHVLPRTAESLTNAIANMRAAGLDLAAVLSMGSINCRCMSNTNKLSNHAWGDAFDFAGLRLTDGREFLVANTQCDADTERMMHRANACLRLSFPHVMDYYNVKKWPYTCKEGPSLPVISHWNHMHCDHYLAWKPKRPWYTNPKSADWRFIRVALGLRKVTGGLDADCKKELKLFAGNDALDSAAKTAAALSKLYMREALRT